MSSRDQTRIYRGWAPEQLDAASYATMRGEDNPAARLTAAAVRQIRRAAAAGTSARALARRHDVSPRQIRRILAGQHWAWLDAGDGDGDAP